MRRLLRDPLRRFLAIGAALFLVYGAWGRSASPPTGPTGSRAARIVVTQADINQIIDLFEKTWQRSPTGAERKALLDDFVRTEIYVDATARGARAQGDANRMLRPGRAL